MKLEVRTVFQNVWGEYKYHSNPYIQGKVNRGNSEYRVIPNTSRSRVSPSKSWISIDLRLQLRIGLQVSFIKPESGGHIVRASELTVRNAKMIIVGKR